MKNTEEYSQSGKRRRFFKAISIVKVAVTNKVEVHLGTQLSCFGDVYEEPITEGWIQVC